jgi:RNA polymerase sigma-70 factor, ECF subfamily
VAVLGIEVGEVWVEPSSATGEDEFQDLYRQWWSEAVVLCRRLLGRACDAEDAAQEAFLRAWLARDQYSPTQPYWPWLATIARRLCVDWQRRHGRESAETDTLDVEIVQITPERVVVAAADLEIVFEAIDDLRGRDRRALVLREFEGLSYQRIAAVEGVTVEAVRGSLKRARATLRQSMLHDGVFGSGLRADDQGQRPVPRRFRRNLSSG